MPRVTHQLKQGVSGSAEAPVRFALEIGRRPTAQFLRVVQDLADHLSPHLGVAPEFALYKHRQTRSRDHEIIDGACRRVEFSADRDRAAEQWIYLRDRQ